jgi:hypothetical protein
MFKLGEIPQFEENTPILHGLIGMKRVDIESYHTANPFLAAKPIPKRVLWQLALVVTKIVDLESYRNETRRYLVVSYGQFFRSNPYPYVTEDSYLKKWSQMDLEKATVVIQR